MLDKLSAELPDFPQNAFRKFVAPVFGMDTDVQKSVQCLREAKDRGGHCCEVI